MAIGLKQFERLGLRHVASSDWIEHIIRAVISCNACIVRTFFGPQTYLHVIGQLYIITLVQEDHDTSSINANSSVNATSFVQSNAATSSVNATSSYRICEQCREQYHGQYRICEQYHFSFYAPSKVFDCLDVKIAIHFAI